MKQPPKKVYPPEPGSPIAKRAAEKAAAYQQAEAQKIFLEDDEDYVAPIPNPNAAYEVSGLYAPPVKTAKPAPVAETNKNTATKGKSKFVRRT
jgi:hypothetical protein